LGRLVLGLGAASPGIAAEIGHADMNGGGLRCAVAHGFQLLRGDYGGLDRGDFAEPALVLGLLEAVDEVGVDLLKARRLNRRRRR